MISKAQIQFIRSLQHRKCRHEEGLFIAETPKVIFDILSSGLRLHSLYTVDSSTIPIEFRGSPIVFQISDSELRRISCLQTPNKMLALFFIPQMPAPNPTFPFIIADQINDPGNLGTIIRTADWFGFNQILCPPESVDVYNPKTVQSTMGSISRTNVYYKNYLEIGSLLSGHQVLAADAAGKPFNEIELVSPTSLIIGSESHGISDFMKDISSEIISIQKKSIGIGPESLNASVAAGICMFHLSNSH